MKALWRVEVWLHSFGTSEQDSCECDYTHRPLNARLAGSKAGIGLWDWRHYRYLNRRPSSPQPGKSADCPPADHVWHVVAPSGEVCWQLPSSERFFSRNFQVTGNVLSPEFISPPPHPPVIDQTSSVMCTFGQYRWGVLLPSVFHMKHTIKQFNNWVFINFWRFVYSASYCSVLMWRCVYRASYCNVLMWRVYRALYCNVLMWRVYRASYCNVLMTNEMHNSVSTIVPIVLCNIVYYAVLVMMND